MDRRVSGSAAVLALMVAAACERLQRLPVTAQPGEPIPGLADADRGRFLLGRALFERVATQEEGLGPLYNAVRCSDCHDRPAPGGGGARNPVLKATSFSGGRCDPLRSSGGDNIQQLATDLLVAHGLGPEGVPAEATGTVRAVAPPLYGLGLLEAIPDSMIEALADPDDRDGDGISGRLPRRSDGRGARFGRKGDAADVAEFVDSALRFELGLTTPGNPVEETRNGVRVPELADPAPEPEIDEQGFGLLTDYVRFLAAPPRESPPDGQAADRIALGEELFGDVGCSRCHVPELTTGRVEPPALRSRTVHPFSDLLVHDLGRGAGDVCGEDVAPGEYRTAPLWGLRYRDRYMHDGTATDLVAAISLHGGEAQASQTAFFAMSDADRALLLRFLDSL
jgi:CxxC motif-containing protein (DUF1111 family)